MKVYLDNAATTPLIHEVKEVMKDMIDNTFGNPSSIHAHGRASKIIVESARKLIAKELNASIGEIYFTSGATEANNMAIICSVRDLGVKRVISSPMEHHCILHTLDHISHSYGTEIIYLNVDNNGQIDYDQLESLLSDESMATLVSLMHVNNEIGHINDIERISQSCTAHNAIFHCDSAQSIGKLKIDLEKTPIQFLSGASHKFFGPKGIGFFYMSNTSIIKPLFHGGDQERGIRSGTENIYGIGGMAKAFELAYQELEQRKKTITQLSDYFINKISETLPQVNILGDRNNCLYNIVNVSFPESDRTEMLMMNLDIKGISASSGSACSSGVEHSSHVLNALKVDPTRKSIRFSFSHLNTIEEIDYVVNCLNEVA